MQPGASDDTHAHVARARPWWTTPLRGRAPRARGTRSSCVLGGLLVVAVVSTRWVRLHRSPRRPPGLYRLTALRAPRTRGMGVVLPVPRVCPALAGRLGAPAQADRGRGGRCGVSYGSHPVCP